MHKTSKEKSYNINNIKRRLDIKYKFEIKYRFDIKTGSEVENKYDYNCNCGFSSKMQALTSISDNCSCIYVDGSYI